MAASPARRRGLGAGVDQRRRLVPDRWLVAALAVLVVNLAFVGALLVRDHGRVSRLVHAAPPWSDAARAPGSLDVQPADKGFDGQFFYRLGVSPLSRDRLVAGVRFDLPALRNARWAYGALAWAVSGGDRDLVPWALLGVNLAAAAAVGGLAAGLARSAGRHAAWGLLVALWPGFAYSISLDTSELVASAFVLAGLLAARRRRWVWCGLALATAVLARDTAIVVPLGLAVAGTWAWLRGRRVDATGQVAAGGFALAVFGGWQILQRARFGSWPLTSSGDNNLAAPFTGLVHELRRSFPPSGGTEAFRLLSAAILVAALIAAGMSLRRSSSPTAEKVAWAPAVLVVMLLNAYLWSGATAFMRASTEAYLLSALVLLGSRRRWTDLVAMPVAGLWLLTAVAQVAKAG